MKAYNSYEEAKIANPECEIYKFDKSFTCDSNRYGQSFPLCNPADHCMTVEKFLADGNGFAEGDIVLNSGGKVIILTRRLLANGWDNSKCPQDDKRYILRAEALNKPKRVNVEYAPINNGNELITYRNELFFKHDSGDYVWTENHTMRSVLNHMDNDNLFRRIETEFTERDEFIEAYLNKAKTAPPCSDADFAGILFDSGKFKLVEGE